MIHLFLLLKELFLFLEVFFGVFVQLLELPVGLGFVRLLLPSVVLLLLYEVLQYRLLVVQPSVFRHDGVPVRWCKIVQLDLTSQTDPIQTWPLTMTLLIVTHFLVPIWTAIY